MSFMKKTEPQLPPAALGSKQTIQARNGVATFIPKGHTLTIVNTYGRQVVDTWAFALNAPPTKEEWEEDNKDENEITEEDENDDNHTEEISGQSSHVLVEREAETPPKSEQAVETGEQEVEKGEEEEITATSEEKPTEEQAAIEAGEDKEEKQATDESQSETKKEAESEPTKNETAKNEDKPPEKKGWSAYIPSVRGISKQQTEPKPKEDDTTQRTEKAAGATSKTWSSYIPSIRGTKKDTGPKEQRNWSSYLSAGHGVSSYIPNQALSSFATMHQRDPTKSIAEQLYDFSKTPVGAAGISIASGSGYASSFYAAYSAYSAGSPKGDKWPLGMEFMSMPHTRASTQHMTPRVGDILVTNLRAPILTLVEDTSPGVHDTMMAACDPQRYRELGVEKWEEHRSCAENLVLALSELNARAGLKGRKAVGADVSVNRVPAPLNLFMNIPWTENGDLSFDPPKGKRGDYVKFRAERDVVVVMSACPQDILEINAKKPMVAHYMVENPSEEDKRIAEEREQEAKRIIEKARLRIQTDRKQRPEPIHQGQSTRSATSGNAANLPPRQPLAPVRQSSDQRIPPRKLDRRSLSRKSSSQMSIPRKETQRVEPSPPPKARPTAPVRSKPRKLERRTSSQANTPRA